MAGQSLLVIIVVGIIAGWLAGELVAGGGFGLIGDLVIGVIGAFIGGWVLPRAGLHLGVGIVASIIDATIGAVLLLLAIRIIRGGNRWGRRW
ncbi:MAG: GlsB/YeaQ/YmgE family stress response membrane protein [Beijerinckiaceae bacterium]